MRTPSIELWALSLTPPPPDLDAICDRIVTLEERRAAERFVDRDRRRQALSARALARLALSDRFGRPPERWRFTTDSHGRPRLANAPASADVNWSHTRGCVFCGVAEGAAIGVDVERLDRSGEVEAIASRIVTDHEERLLAPLPRAERAEALLRLWTLKEAWSKAIGRGLAVDFRSLAFASIAPPIANGPCSETASFWSQTLKPDVIASAAALGDHPASPIALKDASAFFC